MSSWSWKLYSAQSLNEPVKSRFDLAVDWNSAGSFFLLQNRTKYIKIYETSMGKHTVVQYEDGFEVVRRRRR